MTAIVRTGEKGVDFSFARPPAARLRELGYTFVVGYISVYPASPAKNITKPECEAYIANGLKVLLVWEMSATRASLGEMYGKADGANARQLAKARGYPIDVPILVADDTNTIATNIDAQEAYMRAFAAACYPYPIGIYGDIDILARCEGLWQVGWLPNAWSWSGSSRKDAEAKARAIGAHVLQHTGFYIDNTWAVDPNEAIADFPAWGLELPPPTPTPPGDDDMEVITNDEPHTFTDGNTYQPGVVKWVLGTVKRHLQEEEWRKVYGGVAGIGLSNASLASIPDYAPPTGGGTAPTKFTVSLTGTAVA